MQSLDRLKADNPGLMTEIQNACLNQQAFLFVRPQGGWVLKPIVDKGVVGVLVWAAWSSKPDGIKNHQPEIEKLCRMIGGRFMRFHSGRRGFLRLASSMGMAQTGTDEAGRFIFDKKL